MNLSQSSLRAVRDKCIFHAITSDEHIANSKMYEEQVPVYHALKRIKIFDSHDWCMPKAAEALRAIS